MSYLKTGGVGVTFYDVVLVVNSCLKLLPRQTLKSDFVKEKNC